MLDFYTINKKYVKKDGCYIVYPEFSVGGDTEDLMIRGRAFYAVWNPEKGFWSTKESDVQKMVDRDIFEESDKIEVSTSMQLLKNFSSNKWTEWQKYCKSLPDKYHDLDKKIIFSNQEAHKEDYVTKKLKYPLIEQETPAYDELMSTIYNEDARQKLEWAVGAIITGDSKWIQKFIVLYGPPGAGKSTFLNIIQGMFPGYYSLFNAKNMTGNKDFALETMKDNPLIGIQHEGDLSRIEDNTILNSVVSHEELEVNEKYKSKYTQRFESFLFMATNKPVKITDSKSGILRRLIDVNPTGEKVPKSRFNTLWKQVKFEYSGIAWRCLKVYEKLGPSYYDDYIPLSMIGETNDIFNFIEDNYDLFNNEEEDGLALSVLWRRYKEYCEEANVSYPLPMRAFKVEMKEYFKEFKERDGHRYSVYKEFKKEKFNYSKMEMVGEPKRDEGWLRFDCDISLLDDVCKDCPAQKASSTEKPLTPWDVCKTTLKDINTKKLHYVRVPEQLIVIDFDLKDGDGNKSYELNLKAAESWPQTYSELSKSGAGIHLHYWYDGDTSELSRIFAEDVEIKVFSGKSSLRRCLTKCNDIPIAHISSGLPLRERKSNMLKNSTVKSERALRELVLRNMRKEIHPGTKPSIDFIYKILEDAYNSGLKYDLTDMRPALQNFALNSTHQAEYCLRMLNNMKFQSEEQSENTEGYKEDTPIVFFDVEVFINLFVVCLKRQGPGNAVIKLINPKPSDVEEFTKFRLVGFNNRRYDNHILYARMMGYNNEKLYKLSQRIISGDKDAFFGEAYNLSYTDIYDFLSASNKMSLKKWEIKLGIHHMELGLPWDQPVPEHLWPKVAEYCGNDVIATEAVWDSEDGQSDWMAREILAEWAEMTPNDTTNSLTTKLIVGNEKNPQDKFIYTDLSTIFPGYEYDPYGVDKSRYKPGVKIVQGKSLYKGKDPGEGGYAIGYPGIYYRTAILDIASMHPHSAIRLKIFGEEYTLKFENIVSARIFIKHEMFEEAKKIVPERLHKYLNDKKNAKKLANALKTAINSVYGLTSAKFPNKLRDPRNKDNIVAKYGALFMIDLEEEVTKRGYKVVHIKTDSIKIANADDEIIQFVMDYGKEYGFTFEHEDTYEKICLVNDAVYIAKYEKPHIDKKTGEEIWWTATGTQFQIPYVFKTLFSHEKITFADLCETKSVTSAIYLDFNENLGEEEHDYRFVGKVGAFCPMKDGVGGGVLLRDSGDGKFSAVVGTKKPDGKSVYRWMESEMVLTNGLENSIDRSYYDQLVDEAIETIEKYGDFELFVSEEPDWMKIPDTDEEEVPFPMNEPVAA